MKQLKDYLPLYLECKVSLKKWFPKHESSKQLISVDIGAEQARILFESNYEALWMPIEDITPHLRPLSDMTEEEKWELIDVIGMGSYIDSGIIESSIINTLCNDELRFAPQVYFDAVPYLLSKHFDLFDLIKNGLAIDKTKYVAQQG